MTLAKKGWSVKDSLLDWLIEKKIVPTGMIKIPWYDLYQSRKHTSIRDPGESQALPTSSDSISSTSTPGSMCEKEWRTWTKKKLCVRARHIQLDCELPEHADILYLLKLYHVVPLAVTSIPWGILYDHALRHARLASRHPGSMPLPSPIALPPGLFNEPDAVTARASNAKGVLENLQSKEKNVQKTQT